MALDQFVSALDSMLQEACASLLEVQSSEALEQLRVKYTGAKSGALKSVQKMLGSIDVKDKPAAGKKFNEVRDGIEAALADASQRLGGGSSKPVSGVSFDPTLPGLRPRLGTIHPITQTLEHLKEIMGRLGFNVTEGPEIEDQWHNFDALAIGPEHPARDPLDNFYLAVARGADPLLLRSQTSTVQIRVMERRKPPLRIVSLGRVYRPDTADATHYPMFHQVEGLFIEPGTTMAHLKSVLRLFASSFLGGDVHVRFRPSFFPFTEPSVEVDMEWGGRWIEMGGAGMVDPAVLAAVGYDPDEVSGFAFGLGVERIAARRYGVADIRDFYRNDVRFLEQF